MNYKLVCKIIELKNEKEDCLKLVKSFIYQK